MIDVGDVFLIEYPSKKHYHVVVAERTDNGTYLLAFISSIKDGLEYDDTCVLHKGDMQFIKHDSYIVYEKMYAICGDYIEKSGYTYKGKVPDEVLSRIREGVRKSKHTKPIFYKYM